MKIGDIEWLRKYDVGISASSGKISSMDLNEYKTNQIDINVYSVANRATLESMIADGITSFTVDDILWDEEQNKDRLIGKRNDDILFK